MKKFVLQGDWFDRIRSNAIDYIRSLPADKPVRIEIVAHKNTRSLAQNNTLFGVMYPVLADFIGLSGKREIEELHEYLCGEYFGWHEYEIMGKRKQRPVRTTTTDEQGKKGVLTTTEFMDFLAFVQRTAAEQGCNLPDPDPMRWAA